MTDWIYYEPGTIEICPSSLEERPISIILPSEIDITVEQARNIANALLKAADAVEKENL